MKVSMFSYRFYPRTVSGLDIHTYNLSKNLVLKGIDVHVYSGICKDDVDGISVHQVGPLKTPLGLGFPEALVYSISASIHKIDTDIYHSHGSFGVGCALFGKKPLVSTIHSNAKEFFHNSKNLFGKISNLSFCLTDSFTFNHSNALISVSKFLMDSVSSDFKITKPISFVPNGVDVNNFQFSEPKQELRSQLNLPKNTPVILFVGSLIHRKGVQLLIKALADIKINYYCIIVGRGPELEKLKALSKKLNIRVDFRNWVSNEDLPKYYGSSDIFVLPSYSEGLPLVCLEAMAASLPIIATNIDGIPEAVSHNRSGYLFQPGNIIELKNYLLDLLSNEKMRIRFGKEGKRIVKNRFSWEKVTDQTIKIYDSVL